MEARGLLHPARGGIRNDKAGTTGLIPILGGKDKKVKDRFMLPRWLSLVLRLSEDVIRGLSKSAPNLKVTLFI